ncbi:hypothetical protein CHS0354_041158 [Potamilus streckersoni]|uniref:Uncharacterized protein n=1 Tax=Potamilus streckersoni TaxID=2493646 RepID=A0AAE0SDX7_9BIVA|nr:hypothetical protein CHS0354_041158 [Potamilus streckersoni]
MILDSVEKYYNKLPGFIRSFPLIFNAASQALPEKCYKTGIQLDSQLSSGYPRALSGFGAPVVDINNSIKTPCGGPVTITTANKKTSKETMSQLLILVNEANSLAGTSKLEVSIHNIN